VTELARTIEEYNGNFNKVSKIKQFVINYTGWSKSLCNWWLQYSRQVHRDILITLYIGSAMDRENFQIAILINLFVHKETQKATKYQQW